MLWFFPIIFVWNSKDKPFIFNLNSQEQVAIFKTEEGFFAVENRCPHAGAFLHEGMVSDNILTCIWHGWRFDLETGATRFARAVCAEG